MECPIRGSRVRCRHLRGVPFTGIMLRGSLVTMNARSTSNVDQQSLDDASRKDPRGLRLVGRFESVGEAPEAMGVSSRPSERVSESEAPVASPSGIEEDAGRNAIVVELFEAYHDRVFAFLRRLTTAERAEDLTQEVFFRLYRVKNLESREISVGYLFRIGENLVRKGYHREQRHRRASEELRNRALLQTGVQGDGTSSFLDRSHERHVMTFVGSGALQGAMTLLTSNEQAAIRLIVCRGLSYEQAACSLGVSISTINNWKHRGVRKLRKIIESGDPNASPRQHGIADQSDDHGRGRGESGESSSKDRGCRRENHSSGITHAGRTGSRSHGRP